MAEFTKVAAVSEIPVGTMKGLDVNGIKILIANIDGQFHAIGAICTHRGGMLGEGEFSGTTVTCPLHDAKFDVTTGDVLTPPARAPVPKYPLKVEGENIFIKL